METSGHRILVIEDDEGVGVILDRLLTAQGHTIRRARDGREGLARFAECAPDLVLLDLDMPRLGGFEVCRAIKSDPKTRLVPVVIVTGRSAAEARLKAWEMGADDFLTKPFDFAEVAARRRSLLKIKDLVDDLDSAEAVMFALAKALDSKSPYTQGHTERVTAYALAHAARIGLSARDREVLRRGASLHDIGKIGIPDAILDKPGKLSAAEYEVVKRHPAAGAHIVGSLRSMRDALPLIRWHHERMDGRGYPDGLIGDAIPLPVRILSVADVYDAVASERPYRPAMPHEKCLDILRADAAGGGLDPELVRSFCEAPAVPLGSLTASALPMPDPSSTAPELLEAA